MKVQNNSNGTFTISQLTGKEIEPLFEILREVINEAGDAPTAYKGMIFEGEVIKRIKMYELKKQKGGENNEQAKLEDNNRSIDIDINNDIAIHEEKGRKK